MANETKAEKTNDLEVYIKGFFLLFIVYMRYLKYNIGKLCKIQTRFAVCSHYNAKPTQIYIK